MNESTCDELAVPTIVDRYAFEAQVDALRAREKAHTHEGDAIAAARRRLPMVELESDMPLIGDSGPVTQWPRVTTGHSDDMEESDL